MNKLLMKLIEVSTLSAMLLLASISTVQSAEKSTDALTDSSTDATTDARAKGQFSLDARIFYFDRSFEGTGLPDARAFTGGGIAKYETPGWRNTRLGIAGYGSFNLFGIVDRERSDGTNMLAPDGTDIAFVGEAYIDYDSGKNQMVGGRQRLYTPLINDRDFRMLPSVFEALVYRNMSLKDTTLEAGYLYSETGFGSSLGEFDRKTEAWGQDGILYAFVSTRFDKVGLRAQYADTLENSGRYAQFGYADASVPLRAGQQSYLGFQAGVTGYQIEPTSTMFGFKAGTRFGAFRVAAVYNNISGNSYSAIEGGPMYTDWQQGYADYEPSQALGLQIGFKAGARSDISGGFVNVESKDNDSFHLDAYTESVFDFQYELRKDTNIRIRYSFKNQNEDSTREDRQDFRFIVYYKLP